MKNFLYVSFILFLISLPTFAVDWVQIPDTTTYFDKESIKSKGENIYSIETKSPADNGLEYRNIFVINGNTQKFNLNEVKLHDPKTQKVIKSKKYYDWYSIKPGSNIYDLYQVIQILTVQTKTKNKLAHETLQINPDIELLMAHEFYKGIKIKSIRIKQIEIEKDTKIKNKQVIEGEPKQFSAIIEITDMKGNVTELFGTRPLSIGDYVFKVQED